MVKTIFKTAFGIYCALIFLITLPFIVCAYAIIFNVSSESRAPHIAHRLSQYWAKFLLFTFLIRLKVKNKEKIDPFQTYVFVSNHQSQLDIPIFALACNNTFRFLSKAELTKNKKQKSLGKNSISCFSFLLFISAQPIAAGKDSLKMEFIYFFE